MDLMTLKSVPKKKSHSIALQALAPYEDFKTFVRRLHDMEQKITQSSSNKS